MDEVSIRDHIAALSITQLASSLNILVWGISLMCQAACTNFSGLFVCRLFLGMCEGSITAGFMIVSSMFYTRKEQTLRVGYWCEYSLSLGVVIPANRELVLMNGTGNLIALDRG